MDFNYRKFLKRFFIGCASFIIVTLLVPNYIAQMFIVGAAVAILDYIFRKVA